MFLFSPNYRPEYTEDTELHRKSGITLVVPNIHQGMCRLAFVLEPVIIPTILTKRPQLIS